MAVLWVVIGLGVICIGFLIRKYMNTRKYDYVQLNLHCKNCGDVTNGLKCPQCENEKPAKNYWQLEISEKSIFWD